MDSTNCKPLSAAQRRRMMALYDQMRQAERQAQEFLAYLCDEHGIVLGQDGWLFDVDMLTFVQEETCLAPSET